MLKLQLRDKTQPSSTSLCPRILVVQSSKMIPTYIFTTILNTNTDSRGAISVIQYAVTNPEISLRASPTVSCRLHQMGSIRHKPEKCAVTITAERVSSSIS